MKVEKIDTTMGYQDKQKKDVWYEATKSIDGIFKKHLDYEMEKYRKHLDEIFKEDKDVDNK